MPDRSRFIPRRSNLLRPLFLTGMAALLGFACLTPLNAQKPDKKAPPAHWAFRPPQRPPVPRVRLAARLRNPIDAFLLAALETKGLSLAPEADRRTLLRRVTYDLIGLPPTPEETAAFLDDKSPNAYEKVVERLLASPHYGERWARHWLDTAGYADSEGVLQEDLIRPNAWRYRDYVIRAFNSDKPYDRFLQEQIAGDELSGYRTADKITPEIEEALTATGFLRTAVDATRDDFNTHQFTEYQYRMLHDTQTILVSTVMGLTLHCARCHDHKYEPLTQKDYYRVQAVLQGAIRPKGKLLPSRRRQIVLATESEQKRAAEVNAQVESGLKTLREQRDGLIKTFRERLVREQSTPAEQAVYAEAQKSEEAKRTPEQKALLAKVKPLLETPPEKLAAQYPEFAKRQAELTAAMQAEERKRVTLTEIRGLYDQDSNPPSTRLLLRGEWAKPGEIVNPGIPAVLNDPRRPFTLTAPQPDALSTGRRRALAAWLTRPDNPLTARVIVNRLWAAHFGVGLVPSTDNFGHSGTPPTNRSLLDWLACELISPTATLPNPNPLPDAGRGLPESRDTSETGRDLPNPKSLPETGRDFHTVLTSPPSRVGKGAGGLGWSLKRMHRLMVTSAAYRQSSAWRAEAEKRDPENRLLWRQRPRRLEAEALRDAMLAVASNLDTTLYGPPVDTETRPTGEIVPIREEQGGRRSLYLLVRRSMPVTLLNVFDAPVMETNCARRIVSTTATQALALMNSGFLASQAKHFARRLLKEQSAAKNGEESADLIGNAYRLALGRPPSGAERPAARRFLNGQAALYTKAGKSAQEAAEMSAADFCQALFSANEFAYLD